MVVEPLAPPASVTIFCRNLANSLELWARSLWSWADAHFRSLMVRSSALVDFSLACDIISNASEDSRHTSIMMSSIILLCFPFFAEKINHQLIVCIWQLSVFYQNWYHWLHSCFGAFAEDSCWFFFAHNASRAQILWISSNDFIGVQPLVSC